MKYNNKERCYKRKGNDNKDMIKGNLSRQLPFVCMNFIIPESTMMAKG